MQGTEKAVVSEKVCDKIYIFNERERDVGETKVRGDTHITLQTCTAPTDILTYAMKIHTQGRNLKAECAKHGLIRQAVWD